MNNEMNALHVVYSQVATNIDMMYQKYRQKNDIPDETKTESQLKILTEKKYISRTYISDLVLIADYLVKGMKDIYMAELMRYKTRICNQLDAMLD